MKPFARVQRALLFLINFSGLQILNLTLIFSCYKLKQLTDPTSKFHPTLLVAAHLRRAYHVDSLPTFKLGDRQFLGHQVSDHRQSRKHDGHH
jgi:hypothetical protein